MGTTQVFIVNFSIKERIAICSGSGPKAATGKMLPKKYATRKGSLSSHNDRKRAILKRLGSTMSIQQP